MLSLVIFVLAVYGLASALTVLKFGRYFFGVGYCGGKDCLDAKCAKDDAQKGSKAHRKFLGRLPFFGDVFYCPPCISFYIGMVFSVFLLSPAIKVAPIWWKAMLLDGPAAVAFSYLAHIVAEKLIHGLDV